MQLVALSCTLDVYYPLYSKRSKSIFLSCDLKAIQCFGSPRANSYLYASEFDKHIHKIYKNHFCAINNKKRNLKKILNS